MDIILKGGPLDGRTDRVPVECLIYRRGAHGPDARYMDSGTDDDAGQRIFKHAPLKTGEAEQAQGIHNA
jgi:hypothetical protein